MKLKKVELAALIITALCVAFTAGILAGRSGSRHRVVVSDTLTIRPAAVSLPDRSLPEPVEIPPADGRVNINLADVSELTTLPGIGEALARRIVEYRQTHGDFSRASDLMDVSGIGPVTYEGLKDLITTEGSP